MTTKAEPLYICEKAKDGTCKYKKCDSRKPFKMSRHGGPYCWVVDMDVGYILVHQEEKNDE